MGFERGTKIPFYYFISLLLFCYFSVVYHMTVAQATVNVVKVYFFIIKESCELMSTLNGGIFLFYMWRKSCCYYKILTNSANFLTRTLKKYMAKMEKVLCGWFYS